MMKKLLFGASFVIAGGALLVTANGTSGVEPLAEVQGFCMGSETRAIEVKDGIDVVDVVKYDQSDLEIPGFYGVEYVANMDENTNLGFNVGSYWEGDSVREIARLISISTAASDIVIPSKISTGEKILPVVEMNLHYYSSESVLSSSVKSLTVPDGMRELYLYSDYAGGLTDVYFLGGPAEMGYMPDSCNYWVCNQEEYQNFKDKWKNNGLKIYPYGWNIDWITVNVAKTGEFAETYLTANGNDWTKGIYVKVTGTLSELDMEKMKLMTSLEKLDLSESSVKEVPESFLRDFRWLDSVSLPSSCKLIGENAFYGCSRLVSFVPGGVEYVDYNAFRDCQLLKTMDMSGFKTVRQEAFENCESLSDIDFSNIEEIGSGAFQRCGNLKDVNGLKLKKIKSNAFYECKRIEKVKLTSILTELESYAFYGCESLKEIVIPSSINSVEGGAFAGCSSLTKVEISEGVRTLGWNSFENCKSLTTLILPSTLHDIGSGAFNSTALKEVVCKAAIPPVVDYSFLENTDLSSCVLYVPVFSKDYYRNTRHWSDFFLMQPLQGHVDKIIIDRPMTMSLDEESSQLVSNNPDIILCCDGNYERGVLDVEGTGTLSAGDFRIEAILGGYYSSDNEKIPTLINNLSLMRANSVSVGMEFSNKNEWYFITLPYDVNVADIIPGDGTYWSINRYDGNARANSEPAWKKLTNTDVLKAGVGYIVSSTVEEYDSLGNYNYNKPNLTFPSGNSVSKNRIFVNNDTEVALEQFESEFAHNRSWNLIGNPYPAYFDLHYIGNDFSAPLTVWDGYKYSAVSPIDDDYVLAPYESFFVQCPVDVKNMLFLADGRLHSDKSRVNNGAGTRAGFDMMERNVFNFNIVCGDITDRTRIVLNPESKSIYEIGKDAAKFFSESKLQIYVKGNDSEYAIDERPLGDGSAVIGIKGAENGIASISLSGKYGEEWSVMLTDNREGKTVDLTENDYSFTIKAGNDSSRFSIIFQPKSSGIEDTFIGIEENECITVTSIDGTVVYQGVASCVAVPADGIYIVKSSVGNRKVILKR